MISQLMKKPAVFAIALAVMFFLVIPDANAHRSGCHSVHSCPSDTGSYVCGDLGNDSQCPGKKDTKAAKICTKDKKKLDKESAKLVKESRKENLSEKSLKKLLAKDEILQAKIKKLAAKCDVSDGSTVSISDTVIGSGAEAKAGSLLTVKYVGMLPNGTVFDASSKHQPNGFTFPLGAGQVIEGWERGIPGMKVGGKRHLIIPAHQAYGSRGVEGAIPPNTDIIFDIELLRVQ
jgi:FKBP-type peptidyl-prolyl cis-trans isomerase FkpA